MANTIRKSLLEIVQEILITLSADNVNSISDTEEATDVANIVQNTYFDLVANRHIPEHKELFKLDALGDNTRPTYMKIPTGVRGIELIEYNTSLDSSDVSFSEIHYCEPLDFIKKTTHKDSTDSDTITMTDINGGTTLIVRNNKMPTYYTSFDDLHLVFNSYNSSVDNTLQSSKTRAYGTIIPDFTLNDTTFPDLDDTHIRLLVNEAKTTAHAVINKQVNPKIEQIARKQKVFSQNDRHRIQLGNRRNSYGRRT